MFTLNFKSINKDKVDLAGGKGASLGEMNQAGIPVPPGFVVISTAFDKFLAETDLGVEANSILDSVDKQKMHTVERASEKIQELILSVNIPDDIAQEIEQEFKKLNAQFVAVRSSATAEDGKENAWAGQLNSYLNTTEKNLLKNIQKCWASLFTPRAIFYRFEKDLHKQKISVAVVVQKMVESEKSGIAFSVHPVTQDYNQLIIEAGFGLGEAIVSGSITPDSYVVEKDSGKILDINVNTQTRGLFKKEKGGNEWRELGEKGNEQVLLEKEILELSDLIIKIENHYGFPCDIEWAQENGKFYIVQSRPITTLQSNKKSKETVDFLTNSIFIKKIVYPFIPVICFESSMRSYKNNPLQARLGIKKLPKVIEILNNKFEGWDDNNIQKITKLEDIDFVIKESRLNIKKHTQSVNKLLEKNYSKVEVEVFVQSLKELDAICTEVYQRYIYFIHEFFDTDDEDMIKILPEIRIELSDFVSKIYLVCDKMIEALANRFEDVPWKTFTYATFEEIIDLLRDNLSVNSFKNINGRSIVFVYDGGKLLTIKNAVQIEKISKILIGQGSDVKEGKIIKGTAVFKGKASGSVLRLSESNYERADKILDKKKDYILVTPMTRPEIVPFLKKAKAIITNEGGVTCHAAIVARELKIPCIVGTKNATQILRDGDFVEVDADKGVVKILSRTGEDKEGGAINKRVYKKIFNRYLPIYAAEYNYIGKADAIKKITGDSASFPSLYINIQGKGNNIYYDEVLYEESSQKAFEYFSCHPEEMQKISDNYRKVCEDNFDFIKNSKIEDIKKLFDLNANYISPIITLLILIGREEFDKEGSEISKIAREIRYWNDKIIYEVGMKIFELVNDKFSWLQESDNADYITIKEILSDTPPSFEEIDKRRKSWVLLGGKKLYTGNKIEEFLLKNNIILREEEKIKDVKNIRELKIPCIIGTKIATQVLKDGDLVEMDADKGVVRIMK